MTAPKNESRVAGVWRAIELSDGDIIKLFQSGKHGEANYRQFDGKWFILDESPAAILEATRCPHVVTSAEGTSHCTLAESRRIPE